MSYGVTDEGFVRPSLVEIIADREQRYRDLFGAINTGAESVFGQLIGIESEREDRLWQAAEAVYYAGYPASATGRSLDGAVQLTGITRLEATKSFAEAVLIGVVGSLIDTGSQASVEGTGELFEMIEDITLSLDDCIQAKVSVGTVEDSTAYTLTIDGVDYTYTSDADATDTEILDGLLAALPGSVTGEIADSELSIFSADLVTVFSLAVTANITVEQVGNPTRMRSLNAGRILALASTLNTIETPKAGWDEVINYVDADSGREIESDPEVRLRRAQSLQIASAATPEAIKARIEAEVADVVSATVVENETDEVDSDGRPPHSFELIVSGGTDADVAALLWQIKPAGIKTVGDITEIVTDSSGREQAVSFSRPVDVYVWVKVTLTLNGIGTWPDDGETQVADSIVDYGETLSVGNDLLIQALFGPIFAVPGVQSAVVTIATSSAPAVVPDPGDYVATNIVLASNEISIWSADRIEVEVP